MTELLNQAMIYFSSISLAFGFSLMVMRFGLWKTISLFGFTGLLIISVFASASAFIQMLPTIKEHDPVALMIVITGMMMINSIWFFGARKAFLDIVNAIYTRRA